MRPTWKAATIVEPFEKVSGSTSVWWLVVFDALQVAWVKGSVLMVVVAARAIITDDKARTNDAARTIARRDRRLDRAISSMLAPHSMWVCINELPEPCEIGQPLGGFRRDESHRPLLLEYAL